MWRWDGLVVAAKMNENGGLWNVLGGGTRGLCHDWPWHRATWPSQLPLLQFAQQTLLRWRLTALSVKPGAGAVLGGLPSLSSLSGQQGLGLDLCAPLAGLLL